MSRRDARRGQTEITIFGRHPVLEALRSASVEILEIKAVRAKATADRRALRQAVHAAGLEIQECSREEMNRITGAPRHDQGIAARVWLRRVIEVEAFVEASKGKAARMASRLVALDGVTNSQNVGMVVRSVVGAGLEGMLWPLSDQPWINGLVVRAAAGSIFECPIVRCDTLVAGLATLQAGGFACIGLDGGAGTSLFSREPDHRAVFVLGNESSGISEAVDGMLDVRVSIPMAEGLESLNVAVAAGLVCFHAGGLLRPRT